MLKTRNIYVDTEVFVSSNFFQSQNLRRLREFGQLETVKIFMTEITKREIQKNIKEDLTNAISEINKFKQNISNKGKILKNLDNFKAYFDLPKIDLELDYNTLAKNLDFFIENGKVDLIPFELANIKEVVNKYLNEISPFSAGRKKYEFPDAIVLSAIEHWCKINVNQIYLISADPDFKNVAIPGVIVIPNLKILLDKINTQHSQDENEWIFKIFHSREDEIIEKINDNFEHNLLDESFFDFELSNIQILDTMVHNPSLVENKKGLGEYFFQFDFDVTFSVDIEENDYSHASYDSEDDKYYFVEKKAANYKISTTQTAEISIEAYFEEKDEEPIIECTYASIPSEDKILGKIERDDYYR